MSQKAAVALKYDLEEDKAPKILAAGKGWLAEAIVQIAEAHGVPVKEDATLAESLVELDLGSDIPPDLYDLVAEVIWFVHRLDEKWQQKVIRKASKMEVQGNAV